MRLIRAKIQYPHLSWYFSYYDLKLDLPARVVKLGQRRKIEGLVLSGSWVQIPALAFSYH